MSASLPLKSLRARDAGLDRAAVRNGEWGKD